MFKTADVSVLKHPKADTLCMVTDKVPGKAKVWVKVEPGAWFSTGVPSPKSQTVLAKVTDAGAVDISVNETGTCSQEGNTYVNAAWAVSNTVILLLMVSTQPAAVEVNVYSILCVPIPATCGLKMPVGETPVPE